MAKRYKDFYELVKEAFIETGHRVNDDRIKGSIESRDELTKLKEQDWFIKAHNKHLRKTAIKEFIKRQWEITRNKIKRNFM